MSVFRCISLKDSCLYTHTCVMPLSHLIKLIVFISVFKFLQFQKCSLWLNYSSQDPNFTYYLFYIVLSLNSVAFSGIIVSSPLIWWRNQVSSLQNYPHFGFCRLLLQVSLNLLFYTLYFLSRSETYLGLCSRPFCDEGNVL